MHGVVCLQEARMKDFKNPEQQRVFDFFVRNTPINLFGARITGSACCQAFWAAVDGQRCKGDKTSLAEAAWFAGKEFASA